MPSEVATPFAQAAKASVPPWGVPRKMIPLVHLKICWICSSGLWHDLTRAYSAGYVMSCTLTQKLETYVLTDQATQTMIDEENGPVVLMLYQQIREPSRLDMVGTVSSPSR